MNNTKEKFAKRIRRKARVRATISGTKDIPRLSLYRSNNGMFLQLIDDENSITMLSAHSKEVKSDKKDESGKVAKAFELGKLIAKKAQDKKITKVVFDRGGNRYHGRVKAAAEGAREGGLNF